MPGRVVKLLVEAGQEVEAGAAVAVVEAMKMENEVRARGKGKVTAVHVKTGDAVEAQAKLVTIE
jgi:biotin carboxyl carrier protein